MNPDGGSGPEHQPTPPRQEPSAGAHHPGPSFAGPGQPSQDPYAQPPRDPYAQPPRDPYAQPPRDPYAQPPRDPYAQPPRDPYAPPPGHGQQPGLYQPPASGRNAGRAIAIAVVAILVVVAGAVVATLSGNEPETPPTPTASEPGTTQPEPSERETAEPEPTPEPEPTAEPEPTRPEPTQEPPPPDFDPVQPAADLPPEQAADLGTEIEIRTGHLRYQEVEMFGVYLYQCLFSMTYENLADAPSQVRMGFQIPGVGEPRWESGQAETIQPGEQRRLVLGWEDESLEGLGLQPEQCQGHVELFLLEVVPG